MTTELEPTGFWLRLAFMLTGQVHKIVLDYNQNRHIGSFSRKTRNESK